MAASREKKKKNHLTMYLLKKGVAADKAVEEDGVEILTLGKHCTLYARPSHTTPPSWLRFFEGSVDAKDLRLRNASCSAVLIADFGERRVALTFGHGRHLLKEGVVEPAFGLRVALNAIDPERIRTLDRDSLGVIGRRTREQVSSEGSITAFELDVDQDLVRAVTGRARDEGLGGTVTGADSLGMTPPASFSDLPVLVSRVLGLYDSEEYRKYFDWIDHIGRIRDPALVSTLDDALVARMRARDVERMWLAVPVVLDWRKVHGFRYAGWRSSDTFDDVFMADFLGAYPSLAALSVDALRRIRVLCIDAETDAVTYKWPLYDCIYSEIEKGGRQYLLNAGEWYLVDRDFVSEVNTAVQKILGRPSTVTLPAYSDASEEEYNKRVCSSDKARFALMDRKAIPYSGQHSKIEFCDIFTRDKAMIHVKRYAGSSVLSHLFAQGVVAAEAFAQDPVFRNKVNAALPQAFRLNDPDEQLDPREYEVVFGIVSRSPEEEVRLPFFSRVTLRNAHRRLSGIRFKASVLKIPVAP